MTCICATFEKMFKERIWDASNRMGEDERYHEAARHVDLIFKQICEALPEDNRELAEEYEEADNHRQALGESVMYMEGLRDGVRILGAIL